MEQAHRERLQELAQFLKTRRDRLTPEQAGLPSEGRRRTPGLRRGEVAQLSGVSVDWYTWLEQGRDIQVSAQVVESIARALQLDTDERKHFYRLALQQLPSGQAPAENVITIQLQRFLDRQGASPAYVTDPQLNIVGWNKAACLIYGDYEAMTLRERNSVWRTFTSPYVRQLLRENWENHARHRLAQFRASYGDYIGDSGWIELIEDVSRVSEEFRAWWSRHDVLSGPEGRKIIHHPSAGLLVFEQLLFHAADSPHLVVTVNLPADEETEGKVRELLGGA